MGENSKIEWTHHTFNPWRGCTKVSDGCKHCYAETLSNRFGGKHGAWGPQGQRVIAAESYWRQPIKWNREAAAAGERRRVFCASLADVFEGPETMPAGNRRDVLEARHRLFELIEQTDWLDWLLLTKRPQNIMTMVTAAWRAGYMPSNVWLGTSAEDQQTADERIPHLLQAPATMRFLSCEPLLGEVVLGHWLPHGGWGGDAIDWVIVGGESGHRARPMHPDWARSLRDQCQAAGVPFFFKQWGEFIPTSEYRDGQQFMSRVGKHAAGRMLDDRVWNEFPQTVTA